MKRLIHDLETRIKFMKKRKEEIDEKIKDDGNEYLNIFRLELLNELSWLICFKQKLDGINLGEQEVFIENFNKRLEGSVNNVKAIV